MSVDEFAGERRVFCVDVTVEWLLAASPKQAVELVTATEKARSGCPSRMLEWPFSDAKQLAIRFDEPFRSSYVLFADPVEAGGVMGYPVGGVLWQVARAVKSVCDAQSPERSDDMVSVADLTFRRLTLRLDAGRVDFG